MPDLVLLKLGGSLITDKSKPFTERLDVIKRLTEEISDALKESDFKLLVGHGGGSYPHAPAKDFKTHLGITDKRGYEGLSKVADAASRLNRIVVEGFILAGVNAMSMQPSSATSVKNGKITDWYTEPIERLLDYGMLPVVYGDVGLDTVKGSCILSTEELFRFLAAKLKATKVIMCGKTDGVFTGDPNKESSVEHIPKITEETFPEISKNLRSSDGIDVTGGMIHKIEQALEFAKNNASVHIINGDNPDNLKNSLLGKHVKETIIV